MKKKDIIKLVKETIAEKRGRYGQHDYYGNNVGGRNSISGMAPYKILAFFSDFRSLLIKYRIIICGNIGTHNSHSSISENHFCGVYAPSGPLS